jgi:hypothetical protein
VPVDQLTYVTVVFEEELTLLWLQARSAAVFLPPETVGAIIVIDNTRKGIPAKTRVSVLSAYGDLADRVTILRPNDICSVPSATGWRTQQILKLMVADRVTTDRYVTLDAKNHFVNNVDLDYFVADDGRARVNVYGYVSHPLRVNLERVLHYVELDPAEYVDRFTATVTPFVLDVSTVQRMVADIEKRSGRTFAKEFVEQDLTEFFLYSGWVLSRGETLDGAFDCTQPACATVWPKAANPEGVSAAITASDERRTPVFSVHRRALAVLDPSSAKVLADFWVRCGLFDDPQSASTFVRDFQESYEKAARRQRRRDLPAKLRSLPRRARSYLRNR